MSRIFDWFTKPICVSYTADAKPCRTRVSRNGQRCDQCWNTNAEHVDDLMRAQLALEPDIPDSIVTKLIESAKPLVLRALATNPELNDQQIAELIKASVTPSEPDGDILVLEAIERRERKETKPGRLDTAAGTTMPKASAGLFG